MKYLITDVESIGLHPPAAPASGVVEVAYLEIDPQTLEIKTEFVSRINPEAPIHPEASKVHGIYEADVMDSPKLLDVFNIAEPVVNVGHNCVTGDHEVLTKTGWVKFQDLKGTHVETAVWDDGVVHFENALIVRKDYTGEMLSYDSTFHCGAYTPEHTLLYTRTRHLLKGGRPVWQKISAATYSTFAPNSVAVPSAGNYEPLTALNLTSLDVRVIEAARADANIANNAVRWTLSKPRKIARLKYLLELRGLPYSEHTRRDGAIRISLLSDPFRDEIVNLLGEGKAKRLGSWVLDLSLEARKTLLEEVEFWDGSRQSAQVSVHSQHADEMEWLQIAAVLSGRTSKVYLNRPNTRGFSRPDSVLSKATVRKNDYVKTLDRATSVAYAGTVYCLTTSSGAFMVRRNGAVWVTGNCAFDVKFLSPGYQNLVGSFCTLACSRMHIKNTTNHKLGTLADELGLVKGTAHSALGDVHTTRNLLKYLIEKTGRTFLELLAAQRKPRVYIQMPFGKHKGDHITTLPLPYVRWFLEQNDIDQDLRYSLQQTLKARA